ncbi:MAG: NapC/NirT family cytochrome c [Peptococcaceae bacterium]|nr:NapC/NirT family cytochrome c [Peptococcaceae bacterium]
MAYQPSYEDDYYDDDDVRSGRRRKGRSSKGKVILVVLLLIIVVGGAASVELTSQSFFCNTCKVMNGFHDTWEGSSHQDVDCIKCHSQPGLIGLAKAKLNGLNQVVVNLTGAPDPDDITVDENDVHCISCHQDKPRKNTSQVRIDKDPHSELHFPEMTCVTCHTGLTHNKELNKMRPSRDTCFRCHLNEMDR